MACKHKWHLGQIIRYSNNTTKGWSEWACERCGAFKQLDFDVFSETGE